MNEMHIPNVLVLHVMEPKKRYSTSRSRSMILDLKSTIDTDISYSDIIHMNNIMSNIKTRIYTFIYTFTIRGIGYYFV